MTVCWLTLAPAVLDCGQAAAAAWTDFRAFLNRLEAPGLAERLRAGLDGIGGSI